MAREFSVGQVAARCGIAVSAVHFYESKGMIRSRRTGGNQRRYDAEVLRRISVIRFAQGLGITLAEVGRVLERLPDRRAPNRRDWEKIAEAWAVELDQRIARLTRLRESLSRCIGCGCLSLDRCAIYNPEDRLGAAGPGPRKLLEEEA